MSDLRTDPKPCERAQLSYAPTVGGISCITCGAYAGMNENLVCKFNTIIGWMADARVFLASSHDGAEKLADREWIDPGDDDNPSPVPAAQGEEVCDHSGNCAVYDGQECSCGFDDDLLAANRALRGEVERLKTVERELGQMINAKSNLLCNIGDTLRSRGINPTFHMDERVIELAQRMDRAEAMAKDAGRLQSLMDASGQFYENGYEHHMVGRLREYIDSEKAAIDAQVKS